MRPTLAELLETLTVDTHGDEIITVSITTPGITVTRDYIPLLVSEGNYE